MCPQAVFGVLRLLYRAVGPRAAQLLQDTVGAAIIAGMESQWAGFFDRAPALAAGVAIALGSITFLRTRV